MEQHAIPQQISSYQFRLVGDMTLKQFFQIAGGALISLLIYSLPLHPILKWPLIVFFFAAGAAMAFLPFQERPLEKWVIAFFRSVYSPTIYNWRQFAVAPAYFQPETGAQALINSPTSTGNIKTGGIPFLSNLEEAESAFLSKLGTIFSSTSSPLPVVATPISTSASPVQPQVAFSAPNISTTPTRMIVNPTSPNIAVPAVPIPTIPQNFPNASIAPKIIVQEVHPQSSHGQPMPMGTVGQVFNSQNIQGGVAQFSTEAAPPHPAEKPNLIVGQVMDASGKIVDGAILEIKDEQSRPVRALRSNKAGHFMIVTPLLNGKYQIDIEKEGLEFIPIVFEARGEIIAPVAIKAKNSLVVS